MDRHPRLPLQTRCGRSRKPQVRCTLDPWVSICCRPLCVALGLQSFVVQALPRMPCLRPGLGASLRNSPSHHSDVRLSLG